MHVVGVRGMGLRVSSARKSSHGLACSKSDAYNDKRIKAINSQVNEQANSGLQRIRGQLAYMTVKNFKLHCSLFLAIKNMDKISELSVANLVL